MMRVLLICLLVAASGGETSEGDDGGKRTLAVTYVGNAGFLVKAGGQAVLIDALYRDGVSGYVSIPPERQRLMETAMPPFDDVDVALTTHHHADHFDAAAVVRHLRENADGIFVSTLQAADRMREQTGYDDIEDRVRGVQPAEGERITIKHRGITVHVLNLHHGRSRQISNLGFLVEIGGATILHVGDTECDTDDFKRVRLNEEDIDLAFVPYWYLAYADEVNTLRRSMRPARIVAMHMPPRRLETSYLDDLGGWAAAVRKIEANFDNVVIFDDEMQSEFVVIAPDNE
jgi:L-ascorbate metabolism protein UlaG (beta-lactamase superfamily)